LSSFLFLFLPFSNPISRCVNVMSTSRDSILTAET
jgi:hypothetical protein